MVWTEETEDQLAAVSSDELMEQLLALAAGAGRLPERGRRGPELRGRPAHDIVREIILPHKARVFCLSVPDSDEVIIPGLLLRGRLFSRKVLGRYFESD